MSELPHGWMWATLDEIAHIQGGIQKQAKRRPVKNKHPFLRVANVFRGRLNLSEVHEVELFDGELERYKLQAGDLLVVEGNGSPDQIGRAAVWDGSIESCVHQNHLIRVRPSGCVLPSYLGYVWNSPSTSRYLRRVAGSTSGLYTLSTAKLRAVQIPVPPLPEQRRIVAALDHHLSRLDQGRSSLARVAKKATALDASFQDQLESEASAFPKVSLGELLAEPLRNGHSARVASGSLGVRSVTLTAVTKGQFVDKYTKLTAADPTRVRDLWLRRGDILIQRSNTPELVGTVAMYDGKDDWAIFPDLLIRVRLQDCVAPAYAAMMLSTRRAKHYFRRSAKGLAGSMPKIDQSTVAAVKIPLPALSHQLEIVERMQSLTIICNRVRDDSKILESQAVALRRSLLLHAFAGELLPQDPGDESASELLRRIRAERGARPAKRTGSAGTHKQLPPPPITATTDDYQQEELPL